MYSVFCRLPFQQLNIELEVSGLIDDARAPTAAGTQLVAVGHGALAGGWGTIMQRSAARRPACVGALHATSARRAPALTTV